MDQFENHNVQTSHEMTRDSIGWGVLGFFIPLIGLVLYIIWKNDRPRDAKYAGVGALLCVVFSVAFAVIAVVVGGAGMFGTMDGIFGAATLL